MKNYFVVEEKKIIVKEFHGKHGDMTRIARLLKRPRSSICSQIDILTRQGKITIKKAY